MPGRLRAHSRAGRQLRVAVMQHDLLRPSAGDREGGASLEVALLSRPIVHLGHVGRPRFYVNGSLNSDDDTNFASIGLALRRSLSDHLTGEPARGPCSARAISSEQPSASTEPFRKGQHRSAMGASVPRTSPGRGARSGGRHGQPGDDLQVSMTRIINPRASHGIHPFGQGSELGLMRDYQNGSGARCRSRSHFRTNEIL